MLNKDLHVIYDDNSVFSDISDDMQNYLRDDFSFSYVAAEDSFYIGLYKPFDVVFCELDVFSTLSDKLTAEINGNVIKIKDDTKAFGRSGFINWAKPEDWAQETYDGIEAYWVKLTFNTDFDATLRGLNIVFSDDSELSQEVSNLDKLRPKGANSFIKFHVAARNEIIQTIRNGGTFKEVKQDNGNDKLENITKWDILDIGEIKQAAIYLTLAKIYFDDSSNVADLSYDKYRSYEGMFGKAFKLFYQKIDLNDDGKYEQEKDLKLNDIRINIV